MRPVGSALRPAHVQLGDGHGDVVDREAPLQEQVLAHVGEGGGGVDGVSPDPVPLQVGGGVPALGGEEGEGGQAQTLEMMMPAMEILTLGPCSSLYLRSTPFQKEMT